MNMSMKRKLILLVVCIGLFAGSYVYNLAQPVSSSPGEPVLVSVKSGMSAAEIGTILYQQGLIRNISVFRAIVHAQRLEDSLQAGEYAFTKDMNAKTIIAMIAKGEVAFQQFTVPEGLTIDQIAQLFAEKKLGDADKFKAAAKQYAVFDYIQPDDNVSYKVEGFLFPDTYRVSRSASEIELIRIMATQFDRVFTTEFRAKAQERGLSIRETIILASLVEKEARFSEERPIIAGVFLNRLKLGMPLQSCATIQYILGYPKPELTIKDTELPSPYNTYLHAGLPPGPIANPGLAAIKAVLYPTSSEYLYFVADQNGKHHFSKTYEEHLAAIDRVSR